MRDIVCEVVRLAESLGCAIAIESLDFSKKKAAMSEESKLYNEMLSNHSPSLSVAIETGESENPHQLPRGEVRQDGNVPLCLFS